MKLPHIPEHDENRLRALRSYEVLDTLPEQLYDDITRLASEICQTPIALISLVDEGRQWFKSHHGLAASETPRDYSYCAHAINEPGKLFEVEDAFEDERFADNPLATGEPHVRFYSGAPLQDKDGHVLGTLCVIDHQPKTLTPAQRECLWALSRQVVSLLQLRKESAELKQKDDDFTDLVENLADGIFELGERGECLYANPKILEILNMSLEEVLATSIWDMIHEDDVPQMQAFYVAQFKKKVSNCFYEFRFKPKGLPPVWVLQNTKMQYDESGRMIKLRSIARDLSESKEMERALREKESLYWLVSENSSDLIALHEVDGTYKFVSHASKDLLGYEPEELIGKNPYDLIHADDIDRLRAIPHKQVLEGLPNDKVEYRIRHKNGHFRWMQSYTKPIFNDQGKVDTFQTSSRDITEKKTEELAAEKYRQGLTLLNSLSSRSFSETSLIEDSLRLVAEYLKLSSGIVSHVNGKQYKVVHLHTSQDLPVEINKTYEIESTFCDFAVKSRSTVLIDHLSKFRYAKHPCFDEEVVRAYVGSVVMQGGEIFGTVNFISTIERSDPFSNYDGEFIKLYANWLGGVLDNIAERGQLEEEKVKAEQGSAAKASFLSMMSHEIRTPLNGIIGTTHLLLNKEPTLAQIPYLKMLKQSGDNLHAIVNDILDFNKIDEGKLEIERTPFDLVSLLESVFENYKVLGDDKGIAVSLEKSSKLARTYLGDPVRVSQVLHNLLSNGIKFTEKGRVTLFVDHLASHGEFDHLQFIIEDTGIGIPQEKQAEIFEVFAQQDSSTARRFGGSGLGLAITKRLLELMESEISVESEPGHGSAFFFDLILETQTDEAHQDRPKTPLQAFEASVLLVEDNDFNAVIATEFLQLWGCQVARASNGLQALELLEGKGFDLVLMDLQMPVMDGYEAIEKIRDQTDRYYQDLPVIALTAAAMGDERDKVFQAGMNDFLTKPVNPGDLHAKLQGHLNKTPLRPKKDLMTQISSKLEKNLGGSSDVDDYMGFFRDVLAEESEALTHAIANKDTSLIGAYAHKNKSSFRLVGLDEMANELQEIEKMISAGSPTKMIFNKVQEHYDKLRTITSGLTNKDGINN